MPWAHQHRSTPSRVRVIAACNNDNPPSEWMASFDEATIPRFWWNQVEGVEYVESQVGNGSSKINQKSVYIKINGSIVHIQSRYREGQTWIDIILIVYKNITKHPFTKRVLIKVALYLSCRRPSMDKQAKWHSNASNHDLTIHIWYVYPIYVWTIVHGYFLIYIHIIATIINLLNLLSSRMLCALVPHDLYWASSHQLVAKLHITQVPLLATWKFWYALKECGMRQSHEKILQM